MKRQSGRPGERESERWFSESWPVEFSCGARTAELELRTSLISGDSVKRELGARASSSRFQIFSARNFVSWETSFSVRQLLALIRVLIIDGREGRLVVWLKFFSAEREVGSPHSSKVTGMSAYPRWGVGISRSDPELRAPVFVWPYCTARYLVDPASSHMLVSKIKPCMSKYKPH